MRAVPILVVAAITACVTVTVAGRAADGPEKAERLGLWNKHAPQGDGTFEPADAFVTVHRSKKANGTAVVICPGGG